MEEIIRFVMLAQSARFTVSELCEQFGISRKTGYKYLDRYAADGLRGLAIRSHRPHQFPQQTDTAVEALIVAERARWRRRPDLLAAGRMQFCDTAECNSALRGFRVFAVRCGHRALP